LFLGVRGIEGSLDGIVDGLGQFGLAKPETHPSKGYLAFKSAVGNFEPANDTAGRHAAWRRKPTTKTCRYQRTL
jgi:hypothetical protein